MYKHLTQAQRYYIWVKKSNNISAKQISEDLNLHISTIYRELNRNATKEHGYHYITAQSKSEIRRYSANIDRPTKFTDKNKDYIVSKLKDHWSPEQISGRLAKKHKIKISYRTIYKHIWKDKISGGVLYKLLPCKGKRYVKCRINKTPIPNRVDISERPRIVDEKKRIGDWEVDTIVSKRGGSTTCLFTMVDRKSKFTFMRKSENRCAISIQNIIEDIYINSTVPILTITPDNGVEFANHQEVAINIGCSFYFARPYHSCDRGLNEHTNGKIRAWFPKKTDFADIDDSTIAAAQDSLNNRPRKVLGFLTPNEVMDKHLTRLRKK